MKKFFSVCVALVLATILGVSALAAPSGFVESPSNKNNPVIVEGNNIVVTPFGDRDDLPEEIRQMLEEAYNSILNSDNLGDLCEGLEELANSTSIPVGNLAVSDLFELTFEDGTTNEDGSITVTLKDNNLDDFFGLIKYENGEWTMVEDAVVTNNKLTFTPGNLPASFAIVVNKEATDDNGSDNNGDINTDDNDSDVPPTGDSSDVATAAVVSLVALTAVVFVSKKRNA